MLSECPVSPSEVIADRVPHQPERQHRSAPALRSARQAVLRATPSELQCRPGLQEGRQKVRLFMHSTACLETELMMTAFE